MVTKTAKLLTVAALAIGVSEATLAQSVVSLVQASIVSQQNQENDQGPRILKGVLRNVVFGSSANITMEINNHQKTFVVNDATKYSISGSTQNLTAVAQKCTNAEIHVLVTKAQVGTLTNQIWDRSSWTTYLNRHQGTMNGTVKYFGAKLLQLGDYNFTINNNTKFVLAGKEVPRAKLKGKTTLWVTGDVKNDEAVAKVIADTSAGAGAQTSGGNTRPESVGTGRPTSSNNSRPDSAGTVAGASAASNAQAQRGYLVKIKFKILNSSDMPKGVVGDAVTSAANAVYYNDGKLECYGELSFNGIKWWSLSDSDAERLKANEYLFCKPKQNASYAKNGGFVVKSPVLKLTGSIMDEDKLSKPDTIFTVNQSITLSELAGKSPKLYESKEHLAFMYVEVKAL